MNLLGTLEKSRFWRVKVVANHRLILVRKSRCSATGKEPIK